MKSYKLLAVSGTILNYRLYIGDGFYRSKDPTNSIKVLKEMLQNRKKTMKTTKDTNRIHKQ